jgi:hypothetical protein
MWEEMAGGGEASFDPPQSPGGIPESSAFDYCPSLPGHFIPVSPKGSRNLGRIDLDTMTCFIRSHVLGNFQAQP